MDLLLPVFLAIFTLYILRSREQGRRIRLLATHLSRYRIEKLMEQITSSYLRALDEREPNRRSQILELQQGPERELAGQVGKLALDLQQTPAAQLRISRLPLALPFATRLWPAQSFDLRALMQLHAEAIQRCVRNEAALTAKDKAFRMTAELFLFQHSCHWFCKSRTIASARLLARHQTRYAQLLEAVAPETRQAYRQLVGV
jgi:hypothetical protein